MSSIKKHIKQEEIYLGKREFLVVGDIFEDNTELYELKEVKFDGVLFENIGTFSSANKLFEFFKQMEQEEGINIEVGETRKVVESLFREKGKDLTLEEDIRFKMKM